MNRRAEEFKQPIRVVDSGSVWASRKILSKFIERVTTMPHDLGLEDPVVFPEREREVLHLLGSGHSNREIGKAMGIEERTVKNARRDRVGRGREGLLPQP